MDESFDELGLLGQLDNNHPPDMEHGDGNGADGAAGGKGSKVVRIIYNQPLPPPVTRRTLMESRLVRYFGAAASKNMLLRHGESGGTEAEKGDLTERMSLMSTIPSHEGSVHGNGEDGSHNNSNKDVQHDTAVHNPLLSVFPPIPHEVGDETGHTAPAPSEAPVVATTTEVAAAEGPGDATTSSAVAALGVTANRRESVIGEKELTRLLDVIETRIHHDDRNQEDDDDEVEDGGPEDNPIEQSIAAMHSMQAEAEDGKGGGQGGAAEERPPKGYVVVPDEKDAQRGPADELEEDDDVNFL